jgi:hypothetical protein|tara:strand:+ start:33 stop:173 length:141 start_codon:yes stop_codon:yes gene_type:complete
MTPLKQLLDMLNSDKFYVGDEDINTAKGKYKTPQNWSEFKNVTKRR